MTSTSCPPTTAPARAHVDIHVDIAARKHADQLAAAATKQKHLGSCQSGSNAAVGQGSSSDGSSVCSGAGGGSCAAASATSPATSPATSVPSSQGASPRSRTAKPTAPAPAMPARSGKRLADGSSPGDENRYATLPAADGSRFKLARLDRAPDDFSVKTRLQSYSRTGQACDRCKVRKIRCDALPEGCSHCVNLNLECFVTDRVTGRTERRGYMQELEREKNGMLSHISNLELLLKDHGVEVRPWQERPWTPCSADSAGDGPGRAHSESESTPCGKWSRVHSLWIKNRPSDASSAAASVPRTPWTSRPEQSHLGVGPDNAPLSSIRGTKLSLLGTTIDTTSFEMPDVDEPPAGASISTPLYNKSVQAFLQSCMGMNPPLHVDLPSREDAFTYSQWYFMAVAIFLPVLHKPSFMRLLTRIYDEPNFTPSMSDLVTVHMVFATMFFHCGVRNGQQTDQRNDMNDRSNRHYHYALSKIYELLACQDLAAVQALALIASHTRAFPKPGCGSIIANMALHRALELNLHRSAARTKTGTDLPNELRKRTWWVILTIVVAITGRRGYPLPINIQDFDTEFPEPIADELLHEHGVDASQSLPCPFEVGLAGFKIIPLFLDMYANIYSVRRHANNYVATVDALERRLQEWEAEIPASLKIDPTNGLENTPIAALYTRIFGLEFRLCLRHPSVAMTSDKARMAENTSICEKTAREILRCSQHLHRMRSLDTTWYQMSVYGVCIFSMLVAQWERRFETTPDQLALLWNEMQSWMLLLKELSILLGCGSAISSQISQIVSRTMGWIEHDMRRTDHDEVSQHASFAIKADAPSHTAPYAVRPSTTGPTNGSALRRCQTTTFYQESSLNNPMTYSTAAYGDGSPANAATSAYRSDQAMFYDASPAVASMADDSMQSNPLTAFAAPTSQNDATTHLLWDVGRGNTWHDWTAAIADRQERYGANALLTVGDAGTRTTASSGLQVGPVGGAADGLGLSSQGGQWPLIAFDHVSHS